MLRVLLVLLTTFSMNVGATNWQLVTDTNDNSVRLLADVDSVIIDKYDKFDTTRLTDYRVSAIMSYMYEGKELTFLTVIDANDCLHKGGGIIVSKSNNEPPLTSVWSMQGRTMKDSQGQWMCGFLRGVIELNKSKQISTPVPSTKYIL